MVRRATETSSRHLLAGEQATTVSNLSVDIQRLLTGDHTKVELRNAVIVSVCF